MAIRHWVFPALALVGFASITYAQIGGGGIGGQGPNIGCNLFSSVLPGCTPASGGGTTNFLRADGTWQAPSSASITVNTTPITGGSNTSVLYDNSGKVGERTVSGTGTTIATTTGTLTSGNCVKIDANANLVDNGSACASGGSFTLLNTLTASNSTSLVDSTSITGTYNNYEIDFNSLLPATNGATLNIAFANGVTATNSTGTINHAVGGTSVTQISIATSATVAVTTAIVSGNGGGSASYRLYINPANFAMLTGNSFYNTSSPGAGWAIDTLGLFIGGSNSPNKITISASSGNLTSGTVKIYGIN